MSDARYLFAAGRLRAVANRVYYSMFHSMLVALDAQRVQRPRTHSGALHLFRENFIRNGRVDAKYSRQLQIASDFRQASDYEGSGPPDQDEIEEVLNSAGRFLIIIKRLSGLD
ncbi:MAG: HEPN domain-containing protein [Chloroflexi bacterium]|nr:HEPN domain-containing protein [Chloroflexota bacterium]